jgi:glycosyltransferase involved in cell wall biosynthesis
MTATLRTRIGIIPNVRGVGGPASFNEKLVRGLQKRGVEATYDLDSSDLSAVLVIAGTRHLGTLAALKRKGLPIIQRLDGMNWVHRKRFTGLRHYLRSEVNNWILREIRSKYADRVIYQSEFSRDWWNRVYGSRDIPNSVIYNGVDLDRLFPGEASNKGKTNLSVMVVEGHIKNGLELGLRNVIRALDVFHIKTGHPIDLHVAGEVPQQVRSKLLQQTSIAINWDGILSRDVIPLQLRNANLFFSAELNPPCPNSVIEALASGLPVAAFDSGAIRELVPEDSGIISQYGGNIWNLENADADLMVRQLNEKLEKLTELGRNARITAEKMFGLDLMVEKYLAVLMG